MSKQPIERLAIQSHSSLKAFEQCAFKFQQIRLLKNYTEVYKTGAQLSGKQIHSLHQDAITFEERTMRESHRSFQPTLDSLWECIDLAKNSGQPYIVKMENQLAIDANFNPSPYWDKSGRTVYRGDPDFYVICGNACALRDIKTGKSNYETDTQLCEMAVLIKAHHPEVTHVNGKYLFTREGHRYPAVNIAESDFERMRERMRKRRQAPETAADTDTYEPNPSILCDFCIVDCCDNYTGFTGHD